MVNRIDPSVVSSINQRICGLLKRTASDAMNGEGGQRTAAKISLHMLRVGVRDWSNQPVEVPMESRREMLNLDWALSAHFRIQRMEKSTSSEDSDFSLPSIFSMRSSRLLSISSWASKRLRRRSLRWDSRALICF